MSVLLVSKGTTIFLVVRKRGTGKTVRTKPWLGSTKEKETGSHWRE